MCHLYIFRDTRFISDTCSWILELAISYSYHNTYNSYAPLDQEMKNTQFILFISMIAVLVFI